MGFEAVKLIDAKRAGGEVAGSDLRALVRSYLADEVSDAQLAAFFMAGLLNGFSEDEAVALTDAYVASGDIVDLSALTGPTVDKHSTGGVADSTTFIVGPIVAACGLQLAKLSGRGLGHTGGTLDKLEAIPGLRVALTPHELTQQVAEIGLAVAAATKDIAPADKRTYALRDVTGTVASQGLIAASVMSKKIAGGAQHIVLDVKSGDGAFLADPDEALALAHLCIKIGEARGRRVGALITDMSQPLGSAIGNALEVADAIDVLHGRQGALREVAVALSAHLLTLAGISDAEQAVTRVLDQGDAAITFGRLIDAQGGDPRVIDDPWSVMAVAPIKQVVTAAADGVVSSIACKELGRVAGRLGAGRMSLTDVIDSAVGVTMDVRVGDVVGMGQPLATVHARNADDADAASAAIRRAIELSETADSVAPVLRVVDP